MLAEEYCMQLLCLYVKANVSPAALRHMSIGSRRSARLLYSFH